jgi:Ca2+-transporting ATPase
VIVLFGLLQFFKSNDVTSLSQFSFITFPNGYIHLVGGHNELSTYERSLFFTIFVMLQFWNMFNAKAFSTNHSAFYHLKSCGGFMLIGTLIILGQVLIVTFGGPMFNVVPLRLTDWLLIVGATSIVLWIGEIYRFIKYKYI